MKNKESMSSPGSSDKCLYRAVVSRMMEEVSGFPPNDYDVDVVMNAIGEVDGNDIYSFMTIARPLATSYGEKIAIERYCANMIANSMNNQFLQRRKM